MTYGVPEVTQAEATRVARGLRQKYGAADWFRGVEVGLGPEGYYVQLTTTLKCPLQSPMFAGDSDVPVFVAKLTPRNLATPYPAGTRYGLFKRSNLRVE